MAKTDTAVTSENPAFSATSSATRSCRKPTHAERKENEVASRNDSHPRCGPEDRFEMLAADNLGDYEVPPFKRSI